MATINQVYPLALQLSEREQVLYPRVHIFISSQEIGQSPRTLTHTISGAYYSQFTPSSEAYYLIQTNVYSDAAYATLSPDYGSVLDVVKVDSLETDAETAATGGGGSTGGGSVFISSQLNYISSNLETYGGGGGKSYNVYTRGKSPWTHSQRDIVISGMKAAVSKVDSLTRDTSGYHKDEIQEIKSSRDTILVRMDSVLGSLSTVKNDISKTAESKDVNKILKDLDFTIKTLSDYKKELNKLASSEDTKSIGRDVEMLKDIMIKKMSDEDLEELYGSYINGIQKKSRKNKN